MDLKEVDLEHLKKLRKVMDDQCEFHSKGIKELMTAAQAIQWLDTRLAPELAKLVKSQQEKPSTAPQAAAKSKKVAEKK